MKPGCLIPGPTLGLSVQLRLEVWDVDEDRMAWPYGNISTSSKVVHVVTVAQKAFESSP